LSELKVVALAVHSSGHAPDACPGVEVGAQGIEGVIRKRESGEPKCSAEELAALVDHPVTAPDPPTLTPTAGS